MSKQPIGFDYSNIDPKHKGKVKDHARAITTYLRTTTLSMIEIGYRLVTVRDLLGPVFAAWIRGECQWSESSARDFMQAAERFGELDCLEQFRPSALVILSRATVPQAAVTEAISYARSGMFITKKFAKELIDKHMVAEFGSTDSATTSPKKSVRPARNYSSLIGSLRSVKDNLESITSQLSTDERKSLADDLIEVAMQIRQSSFAPEADSSATADSTAKPSRSGRKNKSGRKRQLAAA